MWQNMRDVILEEFPEAPGIPEDRDNCITKIEELYTSDAYHSLSIEGYRVSSELIDRLRSGNWNADTYEEDRNHRDALAARRYWQAFLSVADSIKKMLDGDYAGATAKSDHGTWYRDTI